MKYARMVSRRMILSAAISLIGMTVWPASGYAQARAPTLEVSFDCHSFEVDASVRKATDKYASQAEESLVEKPGLSRSADSGELAASVSVERRPALVIRTHPSSSSAQESAGSQTRISVVVIAAHLQLVERQGEMAAGGESFQVRLNSLISEALQAASKPGPKATSSKVAQGPRREQTASQHQYQGANFNPQLAANMPDQGGDSTWFWVGLGAFAVTYGGTILVTNAYTDYNKNAMSRAWVPIFGPQLAKSYVSDAYLGQNGELGATLTTLAQTLSFLAMVGGGAHWWSSSRASGESSRASADAPSQARFWTTGTQVGMEVSW